MKKKLIVLMIASCVLASGCGSEEQEKETESGNVSEERDAETDSRKEESEPEMIDGFEKAEYEKFNSYAEENGLDGTLIYIEGKVLNQTKIGDSESPLICAVVEQEDGNRWSVGIASDSEIDEIQGKNVRVFGLYQGFSDVMNLPGMVVASTEESEQEMTRIEVESNGKYETVWKFSDYVNEELEKEGNQNGEGGMDVLSKKKYNIGEDSFDFVFGEQDGENRLYLYCNIEDKSDAFYTHISLNGIMNSEDENLKVFAEKFNFTYSIIVGDGAVLFRSPDFLVITKDEEGMEVDEYFSADWISSDEYHESDYGSKVIDFLTDFIENN